MLDMYIFETSQNIEQLELSILGTEKSGSYSKDAINEIFRIMHTIKGSSAMMMFNDISLLAHSIEDLFYFLREQKPQNIDYSILSDLVLEGVDFIKEELRKITDHKKADGDASSLIDKIKEF
jgi:two-component system chemotaxis sensor kinase CheA